MIVLSLSEAKSLMGVTHGFDDARIQLLINAATSEALQFMNRANTDSWDSADEQAPIPDDVKLGVFLLVQADFEGDTDDRERARSVMETRLFPHRIGFGV